MIDTYMCLEKTSDRTKRRKYKKTSDRNKTHICFGQMIVDYEEVWVISSVSVLLANQKDYWTFVILTKRLEV